MLCNLHVIKYMDGIECMETHTTNTWRRESPISRKHFKWTTGCGKLDVKENGRVIQEWMFVRMESEHDIRHEYIIEDDYGTLCFLALVSIRLARFCIFKCEKVGWRWKKNVNKSRENEMLCLKIIFFTWFIRADGIETTTKNLFRFDGMSFCVATLTI